MDLSLGLVIIKSRKIRCGAVAVPVKVGMLIGVDLISAQPVKGLESSHDA